MVWLKRFLILAALVMASLVPASAQAPKRVALVIANAAYSSANALTNPLNDAAIVTTALRRAGFQTVQARNNLGIAAFQRALRDFQSHADGAQIALIYYAGHGIEGNGKNWLIPTDAVLNTERDLAYEAINLDLVMETVQGADLRVVILDACRNNPLGRNWRRGARAVSRGLGGVDADDVLVIYAAAPGQTASDGAGVNSPFATALAARLPQPDLPIQLLGGAVRDDVLRTTGGVQRPFVSASITGTPFYLVPRAAGAAPAPTPAQPTFDPRAAELAYWNSCCGAGATADDFDGYLAKVSSREFPGTYADTARRRAQALRAPPVSRPQPQLATPTVAVPTPVTQAMAAGAVFRDCADCPEMVMIPAGRFTMGDNSSDQTDERPAHTVSVSAFAAGKYEVTLGEWKAFVNATGRANPPNDCSTNKNSWERDGSWRDTGYKQDDRHPVACVSWRDAQAYAFWLTQKTGRSYRLLTEAEWEYAARAGTTGAYWFGGLATPSNANYKESGNNGTARVGTYSANPFGLHDTAGNLWEWTEDCYRAGYSTAPSDGSAVATNSCSLRVSRGGGWDDVRTKLRLASRTFGAPSVRMSYFGFRLARTVFTP